MSSADNLTMLGRVFGGLLVVLVLIGLAARVARRTHRQNGTTGLRVIDRVGLSRDANLTVVEVANRILLLGVTAQGVTMLADLDLLPAAEPADDDEPLPRAVIGPDRVPAAGPEPRSQRRPVPSGVALEQYPDLASALRAAGRTAGSDERTPAPNVEIGGTKSADEDDRPLPVPVPRTRAEARRASAPAGPHSRVPQPREAGEERGRKRVVVPPTARPTPASGSVLSPRTWRQGIDALRDLTVRR